MKKSLMGILLIMAIAVTACGTAQPQTAPVEESEPAREEISLEVVPDESVTEDTMVEDEMAVDETMTEEETSAGEMMEEDASADDTMMEEAATSHDMADEVEEAADEAMMGKEESSDEMMEEEAATHDMANEVEEAADEAIMEKDEMADEVMTESAEAEMSGPDWYNAELVNVSTGESFKINDFQGKVVLIETMAVWCPICTQQQQQIQLLHDQLGERDLVGLSLDIDPNESYDFLKSHVDRHGFNWSYAIVPPEVSREIGDLYGRNYLNPPAAPMLIIDRQGEAHLLPFGVKNVGELQEAVMPFLSNEG